MGEIRSLAVKAARGAGFDWALAEEAGFAVEWLERNGLPGVAALSEYLSRREEGAFSAHYVCPLTIGTLISDTQEWQSRFPARCGQPLLLAPFLAGVCRNTVLSITVETGLDTANSDSTENLYEAMPETQQDRTYKFRLSKTDIQSLSEFISLDAGVVSVSLESADNAVRSRPKQTRVHESRLPYVESLNHFAHRTYAPATEESRLSGAGAGVRDED